jgi:type I restriction enzyme R subunit
MRDFPYIEDSDTIEAEFDAFWNIETDKALNTLSEEESLDSTKLKEAINEFLFSQRLPMTKEIDNMLIVKPKLLQRTTVFTRIKDKIKAFIETFVEGV